jgi:hypothetical protein
MTCAPSASLSQQLAEKHQEFPAGNAVYQLSGAWQLLFVQRVGLPADRSWTVANVLPGGVACIVRAGRGLPEEIIGVLAGRAEA